MQLYPAGNIKNQNEYTSLIVLAYDVDRKSLIDHALVMSYPYI